MSVNSCTVDVEDWLGADTCTVGDVGGGVLAEDLASTGTNGNGFLYDDVTLPADAGKEICGRITYWPPGLNLFAYENGSVTASANDGTYTAQYQLYADYVATGPVTPITFTFGTGAVSISAGWTEGAEVFAVTGTVAAPTAVTASIGWTEGAEAFAATGTVFVDGAPYVSPARTVNFGGGTNRVDFDGGTNRVNF